MNRILLLFFFSLPALTQTPTQPTVPTPAYDVVSIVPNKSDSGNMMFNSQDSTFAGTNLNAKMLVSFAFGIREDLITGLPSWASTVSYDINAKIVDPDLPTLKKLTDKQHNDMLAQVLADRFGLKTHTESKQLPVYNLVVIPRGPKFKASPTQDVTKGNWRTNNTEFTGTVISIASFTDFLANDLHRTVLDKTNLPGFYDMHLTWAPDRPATAGRDNGQTDDAGPSIFSALQDQLGLKLEPAKGPVTTLVIDHIEPPTPN